MDSLRRSLTAAAFVTMGIAVFAQAPTPTPAPQEPSRATTTAPAERVIITGCVQREADYRMTHDSGRGGVAGTGVGAGNEFVLIDATGSNPSSTNSPSAVGTSGSVSSSSSASGAASGATMAYELSGPEEGQLAPHVGQRVEIAGTLKPQAVGPAGPTGGADARIPGSQDLKLREIEVLSFRSVPGTCPR